MRKHRKEREHEKKKIKKKGCVETIRSKLTCLQ